MNLIRRAAKLLVPQAVQRRAMGSTPFDAAGRGRRAMGWNPTMLGLNTLLYSHGLELLERNRDAVRNSGWAAAAIDSFQANAIGHGIRMVSTHPVEATRQIITDLWQRWIKECDVEYDPLNPASGQTDFYGLQSLTVRENMEAGEVFVRFVPRPSTENLAVPLQLQLIEAEQLPIWRTDFGKVEGENQVRCGIEYTPQNRRAAYHFWKAHPGETMFFPMEALQVERVPAFDVLHVYKPARVGQMRGMPWLTPVLAKLYSLDKYMDSEIFRKEVSSMITGFIKQTAGSPVMQADTNVAQPSNPAEIIAKLEPGSFPTLGIGEEVQFAQIHDSGDFARVVRTCLQAFAVGAGMSEYQISGNLEGISYSSIRAGLLEFRRKCEQYQHSVFIFQFCHPIFRRWMREAHLNLAFGVKAMNDYTRNPIAWESVRWVTPGWPWVDPDKEIKAFERAVRDGFSARTDVCASQGRSSEAIDSQQEADNKRADARGLSYDSDGRKVLTGRNAGLTEDEIEREASSGAIQP